MTKCCEYCGARFALEGGRQKTKEHIMPKIMGGTLTIPVCYSCNNKRGCSMTDEHFLRFVSTHPETWGEAIKETNTRKFKDYIRDHPDLNRDPTIERAILLMRNRSNAKQWEAMRSEAKAKRAERAKRAKRANGRAIRLYGLRSQEERPKVNREKRRTSRWVARVARKPPHARFENDSRQVEITMIRSRIGGARGTNKRVLRARLRQLNVMNSEDHEEAIQRLRIERAPLHF